MPPKDNPHANHRERMRQRIRIEGMANMPEHEILEFLLYPYIPMKDTNSIAHELIDRFGSLQNVFETSPKLLQDVKNMTETAALYITSMPQLFKRYSLQKLGEKPCLDTTGNTANYFRELFFDEKEEVIYMAIVNAKGKLLEICKVGSGDINSCKLDIKEFILRTAFANGNNVILAHNHPSGDPTPSLSDYDFTKWLVSLCEVLTVSLIDHLVIADEGYYSFRENDDLERYAGAFRQYLSSVVNASDKYSMKIHPFKNNSFR